MGSLSILIVEDELVPAMYLQAFLRSRGHRVLAQTDTGERALVLAGNLRPELVILDIHLKSHLNGIEVARKLLDLYQPHIIFTSAMRDAATMEQVMKLPHLAFLPKPYKENDLEAALSVLDHHAFGLRKQET